MVAPGHKIVAAQKFTHNISQQKFAIVCVCVCVCVCACVIDYYSPLFDGFRSEVREVREPQIIANMQLQVSYMSIHALL